MVTKTTSGNTLPALVGVVGIGAVITLLTRHRKSSVIPLSLAKMVVKNIAYARTLVDKWVRIYPAVNPSLVMGIIGNESRFNPDAKNLTGGDLARGGAWGLMQMTLATAQGVAKILPPDQRSKWDGTGPGLLNPDVNVMFGVAHLNQLTKALGNDPVLVSAAYNRGLGGVQKMVSTGKKADVSKLDYVIHVATMRDSLKKGGYA